MRWHLAHVLKAGPARKFPGREDPEARLVSRLSARMYSWHVAPDVCKQYYLVRKILISITKNSVFWWYLYSYKENYESFILCNKPVREIPVVLKNPILYESRCWMGGWGDMGGEVRGRKMPTLCASWGHLGESCEHSLMKILEIIWSCLAGKFKWGRLRKGPKKEIKDFKLRSVVPC